MTREVVVVSAVRTAIGTFGGSLKDVPPTELGAIVVRESLARANVEGKDVGHVVFGHVVNGMDVVDRIQQGDVIDRVRVWDGRGWQ